jgi:hypothetical protein
VDLTLGALLVEAYREFNRALVASMELSRAEAGRFVYKSNIFLCIYSLFYILLKSPLTISNSGKGLGL